MTSKPSINARSELRSRVEQKKHEIEARLSKLAAEAKRTAREDKEDLQRFKERVEETAEQDVRDAEAKLERLREILGDGWDNLSDKVAEKLDRWLTTA